MIDVEKKAALEGLLFVVGDDGLTISGIMEILDIEHDEALELINELKRDYESSERGIRIHFLGNTFKLTTKEEHHAYYQKLLINEESNSLSNSALETLAIIAYNEPITRIEVDEIRGVNTGQMIRKLVAKGLLKECGRSEMAGHPILYKTTSEFLDYFGLESKDELPKFDTQLEEVIDDIDLYKSKYIEDYSEN